MRIIAGSAKGHKIFAPKGKTIRPTIDRVRESLFNILQPIIFEAKVLDLFAGTGAFGIEALSRGAKHVTFVDHWLPAINSIKRNLNETKLDAFASIYYQDSICFLKKNINRYDIIFVDPPYNTDLALAVLNYLLDKLTSNGIVVVETCKRARMPEQLEILFQYRKVIYGDTAIWFYKYANNEVI